MPSFTVGAELPIAAQKIWQALKDAPVIIPKIAPHAVASIEQIGGPTEEVGAVRITKLGSAAPPGAFVKEKLTALDQASMSATTEEIEGGHLSQGLTKWVSIVKFTPISDSSCKWETVIEYEGGSEAVVATSIARAKEGLPKMMSGLVEYVSKE